MCNLSETALKGYLAESLIKKAGQAEIEELNLQIAQGKKASKTVCQYVDWFLSTYDPNSSENSIWVKSTVHPCQKRPNDINAQDSDADYVDLLNTVQRHTRCSTNYCLRKKQSESELKCSFKFPFEPCINTKLEFEPIHTNNSSLCQYRAKITTRRNDSRLINAFNYKAGEQTVTFKW